MTFNLKMKFDNFFIKLQKNLSKKIKSTNLTLSLLSILFLTNIVIEVEQDFNFFNLTLLNFYFVFLLPFKCFIMDKFYEK